MRPTIPLARWRLAVDLAATRAVNALDVLPARRCRDCADCQRWAAAHVAALPARLAHELRRIGLDPAQPSDLWRSTESGDDDSVRMRVSYHAVGEILSGPAGFRLDPEGKAGRQYVPDDDAPDRVHVAVAYQSQLGMPDWATAMPEPLLAIDLWVAVP